MFATIELQKQAAADRYYHQLHPKPWAKSEKEWNWVAECNNIWERYTRKNVLFLR
jgi:hypothetical protein